MCRAWVCWTLRGLKHSARIEQFSNVSHSETEWMFHVLALRAFRLANISEKTEIENEFGMDDVVLCVSCDVSHSVILLVFPYDFICSVLSIRSSMWLALFFIVCLSVCTCLLAVFNGGDDSMPVFVHVFSYHKKHTQAWENVDDVVDFVVHLRIPSSRLQPKNNVFRFGMLSFIVIIRCCVYISNIAFDATTHCPWSHHASVAVKFVCKIYMRLDVEAAFMLALHIILPSSFVVVGFCCCCFIPLERFQHIVCCCFCLPFFSLSSPILMLLSMLCGILSVCVWVRLSAHSISSLCFDM